METKGIQRVLIWSAPLRLAHWLMALAVIVSLATGWLISAVPQMAAASRDYHAIAGYILIIALLLRFYLLWFGGAAANWRDCVPEPEQLRAAVSMIKFYLTIGRAPLPRWYAHNPLWGPIYLFWLAVLAAQALTGLAMQSSAFDTLTTEDLHVLGARIIAITTVVISLPCSLHDLQGTASDVSTMISGYLIIRH